MNEKEKDMKKWWIPVLAVVVVLAIVLTAVLLTMEPKALRALKKEISKKGYSEEDESSTVLLLSEGSKAYTNDNGVVVLYRVVDNRADGYVCLVRIFLNEDSLKSGVYSWDCELVHDREGTFKMEGTILASTFSKENKDIGCTFTYRGDKATALFKIYLEGYAFEALCDTVADFGAYLAASEMEYTAADYGFTAFDEKSN